MDPLSKFEGRFVKLVFRDGDTVVAKRGRLVSVGDNFVELHTQETDLLVNLSDIVKIQRRNQGGER